MSSQDRRDGLHRGAHPAAGLDFLCDYTFLLLLCALRDVPEHVFAVVIRVFGELAA